VAYLRKRVLPVLGAAHDPLDVLRHDVLVGPKVHDLLALQVVHHPRVVGGEVQQAVREGAHHLITSNATKRAKVE
jgi:hypothetical protein